MRQKEQKEQKEEIEMSQAKSQMKGRSMESRVVGQFDSFSLSSFTMSSISQSRLVTPAAIAGVTRSDLWMRTNQIVVIHEVQGDRML